MISQDLPPLDHHAFPAYPRIECYFPSESSEQARLRLARAIERGDGPGLLIGASGTGKSLLLQVLAEQFRERFDVATLSCAQLCTRRALLQAILFELGLPYRYHDEGELRLTLLDHLLPSERCPHGILLLVDEAQSLPARLLEEIRLLTNIMRDGRPRTRLVLAGSPNLEEVLATPEMESLQQRIGARCYLAPFGTVETEQYIQAQLSTMEDDGAPIFDADAFRAVYDATDGVPRLVNQLCDAALLIANRSNASRVGPTIVQESWAELQQLPTPWETEPASLAARSSHEVVEFGQLEAETDEADPANGQDLVQSAEPVADQLVSSPKIGDDDEVDDDLVLESRIESANTPCIEEIVPADHLDEHGNEDIELCEVTSLTYEAPARSGPIQLPVSEKRPLLDVLGKTFELAGEEAVDPFQEAFDHEIVLDSFSVLGDAFHAGSPKVENQADGKMATLIQEALEIGHSRHGNFETVGFRVNDPDIEYSPDEEVADILESAPLISLGTETEAGIDSGIDPGYDPVYPEDEIVASEDSASADSSVTLKYTTHPDKEPLEEDSLALVAAPQSAATVAAEHGISQDGISQDGIVDDGIVDDGISVADIRDDNIRDDDLREDYDDILIIEDVPIEDRTDEPTVRRIDYGQLFANLRRG